MRMLRTWIYGIVLMIVTVVSAACTVSDNKVDIDCGVKVVVIGAPAPTPTPTPTLTPDQGQEGELPDKYKWGCVTSTDPTGDGKQGYIKNVWKFWLPSNLGRPSAEEHTRKLWRKKYPYSKYRKYKLVHVNCMNMGTEQCVEGGDDDSNTSGSSSGSPDQTQPQNVKVVVITQEQLARIDYETLYELPRMEMSIEEWEASGGFILKSSDISPSDTDE